VVDDNPAKRLAVSTVLESPDHEIVTAESGPDALRFLLHNDCAVILMDVRMPGMDGFETARLIRSRRRTESVPIIFITAYSHAETDMLQGYSLGGVDFIFTPIVADILRAKVSVFVDLYRQMQTIRRHEEHLESLVEERTEALTVEIAERVQAQERLYHLAHHDALTDMPNRMLFVDHLKQALNRAQWRNRSVAVLFLDLDRFKLVNDTLGHEAGDRLLREMSARLCSCVREGDIIARFGGDEFAIFLNDVAAPDDVPPLARKFLEVLEPPFVIDGHEFFVSGSIGISLYPGDGDSTEMLMKHADTAMYQAKQQGGNTFQFYEPAMNAQTLKRFRLEGDLRRALEREEFVVHYQPQMRLDSGEMIGVEALLRWRRGDSDLVMPMEFVPLLEETGLIVPVGEWVLRHVCQQQLAWIEAGLPALSVAVNISICQFFNTGCLAETVGRVLRETGIDPSLLELEITETALMSNVDRAIGVAQALAGMGVRLAIDDFGTGYSSLNYLKRFPVHVLKIDQTFIHELTRDEDDAKIVNAIIAMAHGLGIKVTAEGVDNREQMDFLLAQGCDFAQGNYLSAARSGADIACRMRRGRCSGGASRNVPKS
jgi:diguanylate cyclase (GGDEF)-like protein